MELAILTNDDFFNKLRKKEYARLDKLGQVYLDYTGGNIHPQCLADMHFRFLKKAVYGNPHAANPTSQLSEKFVSEARQNILHFFNARDYDCVFTQNASGALQIIGECYPFSVESHFLLTADNHNSVNGIREYCLHKGGSYTYCNMKDDLSINESELKEQLHAYPGKKNKLFAFPAQSNVSGIRHSLHWIKKAQQLGWDVLLDAAAFVPTSKLDVALTQPDFVSISFYKMFGYPTGIGCLLVKKSKMEFLQKPWFAGGTVSLAAVNYRGHFLLHGHERFENGTVNYLDIPAITNGLDFIIAVRMENISSRIKALCKLLLRNLLQLTHNNGLPLIKLYGPKDTKNRGGTILFNVLDEQGQLYPFQHIEHLANAEKISLRTGCFCNPGMDELINGLTTEQLKSYFTSRDRGNYDDMTTFLGKRRGAVRISVGLPTTTVDIARFIGFVKKFLNTAVPDGML
jgi:molybdenum cofactor sulfurtransferase